MLDFTLPVSNCPYRYKFEEYTQQELEKMEAHSRIQKMREERNKEIELQAKIRDIKKKQEEEIAKKIKDSRMFIEV